VVRKGRFGRLLAAVRGAWRATFHRRGVRIDGARGLGDRYQAVFVTPVLDGLEVAAVDARDWGSIAQLGWEWVTGDWVAARAVTESRTQQLRLGERRPVLALFDGEPETLDPGMTIRAGRSLETFIATRNEAPAA